MFVISIYLEAYTSAGMDHDAGIHLCLIISSTSRRSLLRFLAKNYVSDDSGTGVVHCAPAFGELSRVCLANGIIQKVRLIFLFRSFL